MENIIKVENLTKEFKSRVLATGFKNNIKNIINPSYQKTVAVNNISFEIKKGEMIGFIGPNGAGKSTTIKLITGILYPDSGFIEVNGLNPFKDRKKLAYEIGTVSGQKSQLWFHLPPIDSFKLLGSIYDMSPKDTKRRVDYLTDVFEIGEFLNRSVRKLSLGQRIRCEIAASLIHSPSILFLDEPSIGLDVVVKKRIRDLILKINQEENTTIFLTSHDAGDIEKLCKRVMVVNNGSIVWDDSVKEMKYSLLNKKVLDLKLDSLLNLEIEGVNILKNKDYNTKLEIDLSKISVERVLSHILENHSVEDMTITNPPMEDVISHIYSGAVK
ncbi:MAG: ATP-binding cassette domain-containing protein [Spirochaetales bacterium]|nr:ATP-binding cassette domain-containing protein [Spirochaetales bacterium]